MTKLKAIEFFSQMLQCGHLGKEGTEAVKLALRALINYNEVVDEMVKPVERTK